eukprot:TRINITY_DN38965_c0_g1_i1.p1 TRINITY_DN38965_c0_g1~~TRINITY_DN38965_c0_g1_i1.p1  ORF type:complete len:313 (+),score=55.91 TRINITY_DN38965_c0_g1_i1:49-939(+)
MGGAIRKDIQRQANKAYADPRSWDKLHGMYDKELAWARSFNKSNPAQGEATVIQGLVQNAGRIDADEYWREMDRIEKEHQEKSTLNPDEISNALRMELYQQRQYLSYKDTMQRLGIPANQVLSIDKWEKNHDRPMELATQDAYHQIMDRYHVFENFSDPKRDPSEHDTMAAIEDGDNRLSARMLQELMDLKEEGKLDYETAGRELERHPEVLRRICSSIANVPPTMTPDSNVDRETAFYASQDSKKNTQKFLHAFGLRNILRQRADTYDAYYPENIPASGFRPPSGSTRAAIKQNS